MKSIEVKKIFLEDILSSKKTQIRTLNRNIKDLRIVRGEKFILYADSYFVGICLTKDVFYDKVLTVTRDKYDPMLKEGFVCLMQDIVAENGAIDIFNDTLLFIEFEIVQDKFGNVVTLKNKRGNTFYEIENPDFQGD